MKFAIVEIRRTSSRSFFFPACSKEYSSSNDRSKWSSSVFLSHFVTRMMSVIPAATISSTTYCTIGLSTIGSISFGCAFVAGKKRVPLPATAMIAFLTRLAFVFMVVAWAASTLDKIFFEVCAGRANKTFFNIPKYLEDHQSKEGDISSNSVETITRSNTDCGNNPKSRCGRKTCQDLALHEDHSCTEKADADHDLRCNAKRVEDKRFRILVRDDSGDNNKK